MSQEELKQILKQLLSLPGESEVVEFKEAKRDFPLDKLGKYFSALSNESNLKDHPQAWIIFGIDDNHQVVGSSYRQNWEGLNNLKGEIAQNTTGGITFTDIHELNLSEGRVIFFQIPPAPKGFPISWKGHYYARNGEQLSPLNLQEIEQMRGQIQNDWSAGICPDATFEDLDPFAIQKAREEYKNRLLKSHSNPHLVKQMESWDDKTFLIKARLLRRGKITRTALLLLGKEESSDLLLPSLAQITWVLKDEKGFDKDYEHFAPPFLLSVEKVLSHIRNLNIRYLPEGTLFPINISQYDSWVIREALHNCIAHQDYRLKGRILLVEWPDHLTFANLGTFFPGTVEKLIRLNSPPDRYRNPYLAQAMVNLSMIDNIGSGIRTMFQVQKERFFPLPDYDLTNPERVEVSIPGKILNPNYTEILIQKTDLDLSTVILLDKVQKNKSISKEEHRFLRSQKLTEGRYPNLFVSAIIASATGEKAKYFKNKGFDKKYYQDMIIAFLKKHKQASRQEINDLLLDKLPDILTEKQKLTKIRNILYEMSKNLNMISHTGSPRKPIWVLVKSGKSN